MKCTWNGCSREAIHDEKDRNGQPWASLCDEHHDELEKAMCDIPKVMLKAWIKAMGGREAAAQKMMKEIFG